MCDLLTPGNTNVKFCEVNGNKRAALVSVGQPRPTPLNNTRNIKSLPKFAFLNHPGLFHLYFVKLLIKIKNIIGFILCTFGLVGVLR